MTFPSQSSVLSPQSFPVSQRTSAAAPDARSAGGSSSSRCTSALPTTTPSAIAPTEATCSGREMPNPTAIGTDTFARTRARYAARSVGERVPRARDTRQADAVDEARRQIGNLRDALLGARRREHRDHGDAVSVARGAEVARFLGRQIGDDHAVHARIARTPPRTLPRPSGQSDSRSRGRRSAR